MRYELPLADGRLEVEVASDRLENAALPARDLEQINLVTAFAAATENPLGYPALAQAILPGDRVTVVVDPELPQPAAVVSAFVQVLLDSGCEPQNLTVLQSQNVPLLGEFLPEGVNIVQHDPEDENTHSYLAATRDGRPVYLNRAIGDADVMIPLGLARLPEELDSRGVNGSWFPAFSNLEMQQRFQSAGNVEWNAHRCRRREETEEVAWLLGSRLVAQVLPGSQGAIDAVLSGDCDEVERVGSQAMEKLWLREIEQPVPLVVATLDNAPESQSWRQLARALAMAAPAVSDGGAIVLWTELSVDPGAALRSLARFEESDDEQRLALLQYRGADAIAAKIVGDCLRNFRLYLHSNLADSLVEEIGMAPLHTPAELQRLIDQAPRCLLLGSAQYAGVHLS